MAIGTRAKRFAFLAHRWLGVLSCIVMLAWFVSGIVMLFVGYPKLTPWERLAALPPLTQAGCCIAPEAALASAKPAGGVTELVLTAAGGRPHYVMRDAAGAYAAVDAVSGEVAPAAGQAQALAAARAFLPGAVAEYLGTVDEDRWTHSRGLNPHRPLHAIQMHDADATRLYISSSTGQVLLDAPLAQRAWNFAGAWLHWLYMFRSHATDPVWSWTVIILSALGVVAAVTGVLNGLWRWRFSGYYKNGSKSPFREDYMRWHHILGLTFGAILFLWIFSGLMSMNPLRIFSPKGASPDMQAYQGGSPATLRLSLGVPEALRLLEASGFQPKELAWGVLNGEPYILARDAAASTRLIRQEGGRHAVLERWPRQDLLAAARRLFPAPILSQEWLERYDAYYYKREAEAMNGADERRLPALRVMFGDAGQTWVDIDASTGGMEMSMDRSQRVGRWLFNFLHSWDLPVLLKYGWLREAALVLLSLGGVSLSATAVVIGWRRLRKWRARPA